jgi:ADP-ribose pyrophosphatase
MYKTLHTTEIFKHPRITLLEDDIAYEDGKEDKFLKFEHRSNSAQTIGIRDDGKICLIREYSHAVSEELLMFPGGLIGLNEDKFEGAKREFSEETGFMPGKLDYLGMTYPYHRRLPEKLFLFVGRDLKKVEVDGDESEQGIKVEWFTEGEVDGLVKDNKITNSHSLAHWAMFKAHR